jgi:uncharacterized protein YjbI with pentapeptide repeats
MSDANTPAIKDDAMYQLLRAGNIDEFNSRKAAGEPVDLTHCDLRGLDLRGLNADGVNFTGSYFRQTDLRGIDFSTSNLEACSINSAKISGTYFPVAIRAEELTLSLLHGTRLRCGTS